MATLSTHTITVGSRTHSVNGDMRGYVHADSIYNNSTTVGSISSDTFTHIQNKTSTIESCSIWDLAANSGGFNHILILEISSSGYAQGVDFSDDFTTMEIGPYKCPENCLFKFNSTTRALIGIYLTQGMRNYLGTDINDTYTLKFTDDAVSVENLTIDMPSPSTEELVTLEHSFILKPGEFFGVTPVYTKSGAIAGDFEKSALVNCVSDSDVPTTYAQADAINSSNGDLWTLLGSGIDKDPTIVGNTVTMQTNIVAGNKRGNYNAVMQVTTNNATTPTKTDYILLQGNFHPTNFGPSLTGLAANPAQTSREYFDSFKLEHTDTGSETLTINTDANLGTKANNIEWRVNGGTWTNATSGTINEQDVVELRANGPASKDQSVYVSVTIGYSTWVGYLETARAIVQETIGLETNWFGYASTSGANSTSYYTDFSTSGGTLTNPEMTNIYSGATLLAALYSPSSNFFQIAVSGHQENLGWETLAIDNTATYQREDANWSQLTIDDNGTNRLVTQWYWDLNNFPDIKNPFPGVSSTATDGTNHILKFIATNPMKIAKRTTVLPNPFDSNGNPERHVNWGTASDGLIEGAQFLMPEIGAENSANMYGDGNLTLVYAAGCEVSFFLGESLEDATEGARFSGRTLELDYHPDIEDLLYNGMKIFTEDRFLFNSTITDFYEYNDRLIISYNFESHNSINNIKQGDRIYGIVQDLDELYTGNSGSRTTNYGSDYNNAKTYKDLIQIHTKPNNTDNRFFVQFKSTYLAGLSASENVVWNISGYNGPTATVTMTNASASSAVSEDIVQKVNLNPIGGSVAWDLTQTLTANNWTARRAFLGNCLIKGDSWTKSSTGADMVIEPIYEGEPYRATVEYEFANDVYKRYTVEGEILDGTRRYTMFGDWSNPGAAYKEGSNSVTNYSGIELHRNDAATLMLVAVLDTSAVVQHGTDSYDWHVNETIETLLANTFTIGVSNLSGGTIANTLVSPVSENNLLHPGPIHFIPNANATTWSVTLSATFASGKTFTGTWSGTIVDDYGIRVYGPDGSLKLDKNSQQSQVVGNGSGSMYQINDDVTVLATETAADSDSSTRWLTIQEADSTVNMRDNVLKYKPWTEKTQDTQTQHNAIVSRYSLNTTAYRWKVFKV